MPKWIYTQPILPKCHSPHFLSPTSFFSRSVAHPSKICKQKHLSKFQKQFKFPLQTQKESKQNNPPSADPQNAQKQNQKDTTIHFIQPPQLEKLTSSTPPNSPQTTVKIPETAKRKYVSFKRQRVYRQTPKRFRQNVKEFPSKRKDVSPPVTSPHSCFPKAHIKIPLNRFQNLLNTPNLCVNNPIQKTSEKGLPCILPSERINPSRQKDRNPARILHKRHHSFPEKEKRTKKKNRKKSIEKRIFTIHITINS